VKSVDLSAMMGGSKPSDKAEQPKLEYTAQAASPLIGVPARSQDLVGRGGATERASFSPQGGNEQAKSATTSEVKLTISENAFTAAALFDAVEIPFAEVNAIAFADYVVTVKADGGDCAFSRMGEWAQRFYDALCDAYNKAVSRSLFVSGQPIVTANGGYSYAENDTAANGSAPLQVYENSVVALPPDLSARRVPLCFVSGMDKGDYALTLKLVTGESYTFSKLGYDTAPVETAIEKQIRALREKALAAVKELDPTLTAAQTSQLAKLLPEGAAATFGQIAAIAPSFAAAIEEKLSQTRAAESYKAFKTLCDPASIYVGFHKNETTDSAAGGLPDIGSGLGAMLGNLTGGGNPLAALGGLAGGEPATEEAEAPAPYLFWLIAPSPNGQFAAVEFAVADSATFVYRTGGDFTSFAKQLNRALEAISFKREVIRLTDEELRNPENADYYMAAKRTAALQFVRANFAGRVIHSSPETWKRKLTEMWSGTAIAPETAQVAPVIAKPKFCGQCGAAVTFGVKFCEKCGASQTIEIT
jgi:hypothetical protein